MLSKRARTTLRGVFNAAMKMVYWLKVQAGAVFASCMCREETKKDAEMRSSFLLLLFHLHKYLYILKPNMNIWIKSVGFFFFFLKNRISDARSCEHGEKIMLGRFSWWNRGFWLSTTWGTWSVAADLHPGLCFVSLSISVYYSKRDSSTKRTRFEIPPHIVS